MRATGVPGGRHDRRHRARRVGLHGPLLRGVHSRYSTGGRIAAIWGGTRAPELAADYGAPTAPTYEALLARPDVDAVVLATPHSPHVPQAVAAARAGKHVYLEKPMALTVAECDAILDACRAAGVVLTVNKVSRFRDAQATSKRLLDEGAIGDLRHDRGAAHPPALPDRREVVGVRSARGLALPRLRRPRQRPAALVHAAARRPASRRRTPPTAASGPRRRARWSSSRWRTASSRRSG